MERSKRLAFGDVEVRGSRKKKVCADSIIRARSSHLRHNSRDSEIDSDSSPLRTPCTVLGRRSKKIYGLGSIEASCKLNEKVVPHSIEGERQSGRRISRISDYSANFSVSDVTSEGPVDCIAGRSCDPGPDSAGGSARSTYGRAAESRIDDSFDVCEMNVLSSSSGSLASIISVGSESTERNPFVILDSKSLISDEDPSYDYIDNLKGSFFTSAEEKLHVSGKARKE